MQIHPTADVHPEARRAADVEVQAHSIIEAGVSIGAGTVIGPHCVIGAGTVMGCYNRTFSGALESPGRFVVCVLVFRRGIVGELLARLPKRGH